MKKLKYKWTVVFTTILIVLTPTFNRLVNATRTENGYGGECLIWMIPFAILSGYKVFITKEW